MARMQGPFVKLLVTLIISVALAFPACAEPQENSASGEEQEKATKVIYFIIVDGLQADILKKVQAPNIKGVGSAGLTVERVTSVYPDDTYNVIAGILTGSLSNRTAALSNPGILKLLQDSGIKSSLFDGTEKMAAFKEGVVHACNGPFNGKDSLVIDNVLRETEEFNTYFNVVILPELRRVAEKYGVDSSEYRSQVTATDNQIGRLLHHLHTKDLYEQSLIVITGTYGQPPLIMKGPQLKVGAVLPPANLTDIAPTIAYLMGQQMKQCDGMVLYNAIKPRADRSESYLLAQRVADLSTAYATALDEMHRLEEEKSNVKQQQEKITEEKKAVQQQIAERDEKIKQLSNEITLLKQLGIIIFVVMLIGYFIEYKLLKKRFLMF